MHIQATATYEEGAPVLAGVLYRLEDFPMVVDRTCEFRVFGKVLVDGVVFDAGHYNLRGDGRLTIEAYAPLSAVWFKNDMTVKEYELAPEGLPDPQDLPDLEMKRFFAYAVKMGLIKPEAVNVEEEDDAVDDEEAADYAFEWDLDGLPDIVDSDDGMVEEKEDEVVEEKAEGS